MLGTSAYISVIYFRSDWDRMGAGQGGTDGGQWADGIHGGMDGVWGFK